MTKKKKCIVCGKDATHSIRRVGYYDNFEIGMKEYVALTRFMSYCDDCKIEEVTPIYLGNKGLDFSIDADLE